MARRNHEPRPVTQLYTANARVTFSFEGDQNAATKEVAEARSKGVWMKVGQRLVDPFSIIAMSRTENVSDDFGEGFNSTRDEWLAPPNLPLSY